MTTPTSLPLSALVESTYNPRTSFDQHALAELAESAKVHGIMQPIVVRPLPGHRTPDTDKAVTHEIIMGARRYRAAALVGLTEIPLRIVEWDDATAREAALVENLQRKDLSEIEEAMGYEDLMKHSDLTADQVAAKIGKSRSYVYNRLKLTELIPTAREALQAGKIDASKALLLARIPDVKLQSDALRDISRTNYSGDQDMGYRAAAEHVQRTYMLKLAEAKFPRKADDLVPGAGPCHACPKRTGANPDLFADVKSADVCTDPKCYHSKEEAHAQRQREEAVARGQTIIDGKEAKALMPNSWSSRVEGYLRLDDAGDSPTDKPLRSVLAKQLVAQDVQPILVANPHKNGELVAVLPADKVAELLKLKGDTKAADKIANASDQDEKHRKAQEKKEAEHALEAAWRWAVLEATWSKVQAESEGQSGGPKLDQVTRYMALRKAEGFNQDNAKKLTKLLALGKVAPKEGLLDWIRGTSTPGAAMLLLVMFADVEYRHWQTNGGGNEGLFLVAKAFGVDPVAIEAQTRANTRAAKASAKKNTKVEKPATPSVPASQSQGEGGGKTRKSKPSTFTPKKLKTTPEEAMKGIAAAMQGGEESAASTAEGPGAADAAQGNDGMADDGHADLGSTTALAGSVPTAGWWIGAKVRFKEGLKSAGGKSRKVSGRAGEISSVVSPGRYMVKFGPAAHEVATADAIELEEIAAPQGSLVDHDGQEIDVGTRVKVVGDQLKDKTGTVASITDKNIFVQLDGFSSDFVFQPEELQVTINPHAAWPFPKTGSKAVAA